MQTEDGYFPMFFNIAGKKILIVGAGNIALRRIHTLMEFHAEVTVIAPVLKEEIRELYRAGSVHVEERGYQDTDRLREYFMVIAATGDADLNRKICREGKMQGILLKRRGRITVFFSLQWSLLKKHRFIQLSRCKFISKPS